MNPIHIIMSISFLAITAIVLFPLLPNIPEYSSQDQKTFLNEEQSESQLEKFLEDVPLRCFTVINLQSREVQEVVIYDEMSVYIRGNIASIGISENEFYTSKEFDDYFEKKCMVYVSKDGRVPDHFDALLSMGVTLGQSSIDEILDVVYNTQDIGTFFGKIDQ